MPYDSNGNWIPPGGKWAKSKRQQEREEQERIQQERMAAQRSQQQAFNQDVLSLGRGPIRPETLTVADYVQMGRTPTVDAIRNDPIAMRAQQVSNMLGRLATQPSVPQPSASVTSPSPSVTPAPAPTPVTTLEPPATAPASSQTSGGGILIGLMDAIRKADQAIRNLPAPKEVLGGMFRGFQQQVKDAASRPVVGNPFLEGALKTREELPQEEMNPAQKVGSSVMAGAGDFLSSHGAVADMLGFKKLGEDLKSAARNAQERGTTPPEYQGWKSLLNPDYVTSAVLRPLVASLGYAAESAPLFVAGSAAGAATASAMGLGRFGTTVLSTLGGSIASSPVEAAVEAAQTYEEVRQKGGSVDEAEAAARKTFGGNVALTSVTNMGEFASLFLPKGIRQVVASIPSKIGKAGVAAGRVGLGAASGFLEEGTQGLISQAAQGEPLSWDQEEAMIGAVLGGGMAGSAVVAETLEKVADRVRSKLPPDKQEDIQVALQDAAEQGIPEEQAMNRIMDALAEDPEMQPIIQEATKEVFESQGQEALATAEPDLPAAGQATAPTEPESAAPEAGATEEIPSSADAAQEAEMEAMEPAGEVTADARPQMQELEGEQRAEETVAAGAETDAVSALEPGQIEDMSQPDVTGQTPKMEPTEGAKGVGEFVAPAAGKEVEKGEATRKKSRKKTQPPVEDSLIGRSGGGEGATFSFKVSKRHVEIKHNGKTYRVPHKDGWIVMRGANLSVSDMYDFLGPEAQVGEEMSLESFVKELENGVKRGYRKPEKASLSKPLRSPEKTEQTGTETTTTAPPSEPDGKEEEVAESTPVPGKEIVLYHGSPRKFTQFRAGRAQAGKGVFLADNIDEAKEFGEQIYEVVISPSKIADSGDWKKAYNELQREYEKRAEELQDKYENDEISESEYYDALRKLGWIFDEQGDPDMNAQVSERLRQKGFDVLVTENQSGRPGNEYLVLDPNIIKSLKNLTEQQSAGQQGGVSDVQTDAMGAPGAEALEGTPAENVRGAGAGGETGTGGIRGAREDEGRRDGPDAERDVSSGGVGSRAGGLDSAEAGVRAVEETETAANAEAEAAEALQQPTTRNFVITDIDDLGMKGQKTSFRRNVEAIKTMKRILAEGRLATPEEQKVLVRYVGWGGLKQVFDPEFRVHAEWKAEAKELRELLTPEEWRTAADTVLNAHYTSAEVITAMYDGLRHFGFKGGRVLEPSMGIGHFIGLMPLELAKSSQVTGVEIDTTTGNIGRLLYPKSDIRITGFENAKLADNMYDVAIGNVPFGNIQVADPAYKRTTVYSPSLHDYFFVKAMDKVKSGGLVVFITSRYTMDSQHSRVRSWLNSKADLIGAIRLPNTAFKKAANTEVVTDILILQKRPEGQPARDSSWVQTQEITVDDRNYTVNSYFVNNPDMVLGEFSSEGSMYGARELTVKPKHENLGEAIREKLLSLPGNIIKAQPDKRSTEEATARELIPAPGHVKENAYAIHNGGLYIKEDGQLRPVTGVPAKTVERIKGMIGIRDAVREYLRLQLTDGFSESAIEASRKRLNAAYDKFVAKFGPINRPVNLRAFIDDPDAYLLSSLEIYDKDADKATKADIFRERTVRKYKPAEKASSAKDALVITLTEVGRVDFDRMRELTGKTDSELQQELGDEIFEDPQKGWVTADEYLSGNVRLKLAEAENAAKLDSRFERNVEALRAVQPPDITAEEIGVQIGSPWLPVENIQDFIGHLTGFPNRFFKVNYNPTMAEWTVEYDDNHSKRLVRSSTNATVTWGTKDLDAVELTVMALNMKTPTVRRSVGTDEYGNKNYEIDHTATTAARNKLNAIKAEFERWLWSDEKRRDVLVKDYNERFNTDRLRTFDGSHLTFPGMNPTITLKKHQKDAVWRSLQSSNTLFAHAVGAGKTFEMIASMMEMKRMGLINKPMWVVPNHLVEQMGADFMKLYPAANILVAGKKDFEKKNRKRLFAKIATGNYDAVIVPHSSFGKIPMNADFIRQFFEEQIQALELAKLQDFEMSRKKKTSYSKRIAQARKRLETKMNKMLNKIEKDEDNVTFEELGVDGLVVDEAHEFKNLFYMTKMNNVAGLGTQEGSSKAFDLFMKVRYLQRLNGGKGVIFATGTPVSNSLAEMYTFQRYLQYDEMVRRGIESFDAWVSQFGNVKNVLELAPEGKGLRMRTRLTEVINVPELLHMFRSFADVWTADMLLNTIDEATGKPLITRPELKDGKRQAIVIPASRELKTYIEELVSRAEAVRSGKVHPADDNMLKILGDGRKAALDMRLVDPSLPDDPKSKVNRAVSNIAEIYKRTKKYKTKSGKEIENGTQLVFLDLSTPKAEKVGKDGELIEDDSVDAADVSVYNDLRRKLAKSGVRPDHIAFIHDYKTDAQKEELYRKMNNGEIRILIGSTAKMGAGMNVQKRLIALHHLDVPWRPSDIEQREGRILRQGNENDEVEIYVYSTEESFDAYMWQIVANKAHVVAQTMSGDLKTRRVEDPSGFELSANEMKALASGDERIIELANLDRDVAELSESYQAAVNELKQARRSLEEYPVILQKDRSILEGLQKDLQRRQDVKGDKFSVVIGKKTFTKREDAGKALLDMRGELKKKWSREGGPQAPVTVGSFAGFSIQASYDTREKDVDFWLKGERYHSFFVRDTPAGAVRSMEMTLDGMASDERRVRGHIANTEKQMETLRKQIPKIEADVEKYRTRYNEKLFRKQQLEEELNIDKKADDAVLVDEGAETDAEEETVVESRSEKRADSYKGKTAEERAAYDINVEKEGGIGIVPRVFSEPKRARKTYVPPNDPLAMPNPESERIFQEARLERPSLLTRVHETIASIRRGIREFEYLPKSPKYEEFRQKLLQLKSGPDAAKFRTFQIMIQNITKDLSKADYNIFRRKVIADDMYQSLKRGEAIGFELTDDEFYEWYDKVNEAVDENPRVQMALNKRKEHWDEIKENYFNAMADIGFDVRDRIAREDYFRHQVLEYADQMRRGEGVRKLRTPANRGFLKGRTGEYTGAYNTDYIVAEAEVMIQMLYDTMKAKVIKYVDDKFNIARKLRDKIKSQVSGELNRVIQREKQSGKFGTDPLGEPISPTEVTYKNFSTKIARAFGELARMDPETLWGADTEEWQDVIASLSGRKAKKRDDVDEDAVTGHPRTLDYLRLLAGQEGPGVIQARTILKAISDRRNFVKQVLGDKYVDTRKIPKSFIPDGYTTWQPREGSVFFKKDVAAETNDLFMNLMSTFGVNEEMLDEVAERLNKAIGKPVLVFGGRRREFIIPEDVANTLDSIMEDNVSKFKVLSGIRAMTRAFKVAVLTGPRSLIKYNIRNSTSDAEKTLAGNPEAFKKVYQATHELYSLYFKESAGTKELREFVKRGGLQILQQVQEVGNVDHLRMFNRFYEKEKGIDTKVRSAWNFYWRNARRVTDFREAIFRYANYLAYLEQMQKNNGTPKNFGSSRRELVMALPDIRDRAFKLANELLVDYRATSTLGREVSDLGLYPFFRWVEGNIKTTTMLMTNAYKDGQMAHTIGRKIIGQAGVTALFVGRAAIKLSIFAILLQLWNRTFFPDEEKELPEDVKNRLHIIFGRDDQGKVRYLDRLGFMEDYLEWFGMDNLIGDIRDVLNGRVTLEEWAKETAKKPLNKAFQGIGPVYKAPFEMITGQSYFPDAFQPSGNNEWYEPILNAMNIRKDFEAIVGYFSEKPNRPTTITSNVMDFFSTGSDPQESAYYDIRDMAEKYKHRNGISQGRAGEPTAKSQALYYYKLALRYNDKEAQQRFLEKYAEEGGTRQGLMQSLRSMHPLYGLSSAHQKLFYQGLSEEEKEKFEVAMNFYRNVLLGSNKE